MTTCAVHDPITIDLGAGWRVQRCGSHVVLHGPGGMCCFLKQYDASRWHSTSYGSATMTGCEWTYPLTASTTMRYSMVTTFTGMETCYQLAIGEVLWQLPPDSGPRWMDWATQI